VVLQRRAGADLPTEHLKIEPWFINRWQSYGRFNNRPGFGMQILWRPNGKWSIPGNQYLLGEDALATPGRVRYHTDDSIEYKYHDDPTGFLSKAAFSPTGDLGCEQVAASVAPVIPLMVPSKASSVSCFTTGSGSTGICSG